MADRRTSADSSHGGLGKIADIAFKILSVVVIPLGLWGVRLEVSNAIQNEQIAEIQEDLDTLEDMDVSVQNNALALVRLEVKIDNLNEKINEVKKLLHSQ